MNKSIFLLALVVIVAIYVQPSESLIFDRLKCNTITGLCRGCQHAEYDHHLTKVPTGLRPNAFVHLFLSLLTV